MPWLLKSPGHQQEWYWQYSIGNLGLLHCESGLRLLNKIQDMIQNVNTSFIILITIQHVTSWYILRLWTNKRDTISLSLMHELWHVYCDYLERTCVITELHCTKSCLSTNGPKITRPCMIYVHLLNKSFLISEDKSNIKSVLWSRPSNPYLLHQVSYCHLPSCVFTMQPPPMWLLRLCIFDVYGNRLVTQQSAHTDSLWIPR